MRFVLPVAFGPTKHGQRPVGLELEVLVAPEVSEMRLW